MNYPVFQLPAVEHKHLASASRLFNLSEVESYLFIKVPVTYAKLFELTEMIDTDTRSIIQPENISHDSSRIWFRVDSSVMNMNPGYHIYQMKFCSKDNKYDAPSPLYVGYVIQNDSPDKPYVYMREDEE